MVVVFGFGFEILDDGVKFLNFEFELGTAESGSRRIVELVEHLTTCLVTLRSGHVLLED